MLAFAAKASEIAEGAAEGESYRRRSSSYVEDKFILTTKHAVIAAACSRKL